MYLPIDAMEPVIRGRITKPVAYIDNEAGNRRYVNGKRPRPKSKPTISLNGTLWPENEVTNSVGTNVRPYSVCVLMNANGSPKVTALMMTNVANPAIGAKQIKIPFTIFWRQLTPKGVLLPNHSTMSTIVIRKP